MLLKRGCCRSGAFSGRLWRTGVTNRPLAEDALTSYMGRQGDEWTMLEFLGALLLIFLLFMAVMIWLGVKVAKKAVRTAKGVMDGFGPSVLPNLSALPDPRWAKLSMLLDRGQREQARVARERIRAFLGESRSASLGPHEAQLLISCEKRVPELIDACLERCRGARPGERCDYAGGTLDRLVKIGEEAEEARQAIRARDDGRLLTMQTYFDTVVSRDTTVGSAKAGTPGEDSASLR